MYDIPYNDLVENIPSIKHELKKQLDYKKIVVTHRYGNIGHQVFKRLSEQKSIIGKYFQRLHEQWPYGKEATEVFIHIASDTLYSQDFFRKSSILDAMLIYALNHYMYILSAPDEEEYPMALRYVVYIDSLREAICHAFKIKITDTQSSTSWCLDDQVPLTDWLADKNSNQLVIAPYQFKNEEAIRHWLVDLLVVPRSEIIMKRFDYEKVLEAGDMALNIRDINREPLFTHISSEELFGEGGRIHFKKLRAWRKELDNQRSNNVVQFPVRD